jgi:hypothetical protein
MDENPPASTSGAASCNFPVKKQVFKSFATSQSLQRNRSAEEGKEEILADMSFSEQTRSKI